MYKRQTLIIIDAPVAERDETSVTYSTLPVGVLVTDTNVITVSLRENAILSEFAEGVVKGVQTSLKTQFVLHLILRVATRYLQFLKQIDKLSSSLEKQLRRSMKNKELIQLLDVQKSLVYFSTSLKAVSYTHLDVYKRQVLFCAKRRGWGYRCWFMNPTLIPA